MLITSGSIRVNTDFTTCNYIQCPHEFNYKVGICKGPNIIICSCGLFDCKLSNFI